MTTLTATPPAQWTRLEKIQYLLDQWDIMFDPNATAPFGTPGDGSGVPLLPRMSRHPSVVELARCLSLLFIATPGDYRHLKTYRCGCEWRIRTDWIKRRRPSGKGFETIEQRRRDRITPSWLSMTRVSRAEVFLADRFNGEVFIPDELWDALHRAAMTSEPVAA